MSDVGVQKSKAVLLGTRSGRDPVVKVVNSNSKSEGTKYPSKEEKAKSGAASSISKIDKEKVCGDFSEPKLLTSLKIIESFHNLVEKDIKKKPQSSHSDNSATKKASRKVNIPFDEKVFKGLIDLKVNDEELGLDLNVPFKAREIFKAKEPEPVLSDFYTPSFNREYVIKPKAPTFEMTKFKMPPVPSVLEATKRWEPDEFY